MTEERKNEIWAMLPSDFKEWMMEKYPHYDNFDTYNRGYAACLRELFGSHNLTAKAEEKCTNPTENCISDSKIQSENAESVETSTNSQSVNHIPDPTKKVDYAQYRLDLAKEIAVAVIRSDRWDFMSCDPVEQANEIVKRLKETEI